MNAPSLRGLALAAAPGVMLAFAAGCSGSAQSSSPALPVTASGPSASVYVADNGNDAVKLVDARGSTSVAAAFRSPEGIAIDGAFLYVVRYDGQKERDVLTKVNTTDGTRTEISTGTLQPVDVAVDQRQNVYVAGGPGGTGIEKIAPDGKITAIGSGFSSPKGVAVDAAGNLYVADTGNSAIKKVSTNGTISVVGSGFWIPYGVAVDAQGNVYVADTGNNAAKKIAPDGTITCVYGQPGPLEHGHVKCLGASFNFPEYVAVDREGNVYVADTHNDAVEEFKTDGSALVIGSGFKSPDGIAI
jgi:large repetitive protein